MLYPDELRAQVKQKLVGVIGFEPTTTWSQTRCATRLRYTPKQGLKPYSPCLSGHTRSQEARMIGIQAGIVNRKLGRLFINGKGP